MKEIVQKLLIITYIISSYKDKDGTLQYAFNLKNPVGWLLLIVVALFTGLWEFFGAAYKVIRDVAGDSIKARKEAKSA